MTIYEWADRLGMDPHKSRGAEDFWAICPCHSDTKPSLHVYVGGKTGEIVMKCFVCDATGADVCKALGVPIGEVMCDAMSGEKRGGERKAKPKRAPAAKKEPKLSRPFVVGKPLQVGNRKYTTKAVYEYQDREGRVVLRKARAELYDENGVRVDKSFLIQSIGTDGKWYSNGGIYTDLLYHLPDVLAMKGKPGRVIIAEGEKDVDNLRRLGMIATCGMHGGGIAKSETGLLGKWNDAHSECFDGLDEVVVIADNDAAGEGISQWICKRLRGRVKSLKLLRIAEHYPQLEEHGDFTDWGNALIRSGKRPSDIAVSLNTMIDETPEWTPGNIRKFEKQADSKTVRADGFDDGGREDSGPEAGGEEYPSYHGSYQYCIKNGRLAYRTGQQGARVLCDFVPEPKETITRDDGQSVTTSFLIGATAPSGAQLEDALIVGDSDFRNMGWPMRFWRHQGNIKPVKNAERMILDAINTAGQQISKHRSVYAHTGMRSIGGKMAYLYNGGAIGAENVSVELEGTLEGYNLAVTGKYDKMELAMMELGLLDGMPAHLIYPLLAQAYLAPVFSVMERLQQPPSYIVYIVGASNAGKSTLAGYVQAHFGDFYNRRFPSNFNDTANSVRDKLFLAKDALLVIDDYRKNDDVKVRSQMDITADAAISAVADRADRGRQTADKKTAPTRPSRCTCVMTGEEVPRVSRSRLMRLYRIDVEPGEIYRDVRELDVYRLAARSGLYRMHMRGYIEALLARWDGIEDEISDRIDAAQDRMAGMIKRQEGRFLECATHLMVGVGLMLDHMAACGVMEEADKQRRLQLAAENIAATIDEQGRVVDDAKPEMIWLQTLRSLLATRSVTLGDKGDIANGFRAGEIGFRDGGYVCLSPEACDEYIGERLRKGGRALGASRQAILRSLARAGMIRYKRKKDGTGIGETTFPTRMGQAQSRMIYLYAWALVRDTPPTPGEQGFIPADSEQLPMEFEEKN